MKFNNHFALEGRHAFMSASSPHWLNYDDEKMAKAFLQREAAAKGTRLHDLAAKLIREGQKLPDTTQTLCLYVNESIGFDMTPEQPLFYSENAFGTADAIGFKKNILRISDLKTGEIDAKPKQLEVYAAFFCLEYQIKPIDLDGIELRIYQHDDVMVIQSDPVDITLVADHIVHTDKLIRRLKEEVGL